MSLTVNQAAKAFGGRTLWSNLSFGVDQGRMLAIVGPSGCGKSTLLNCLGLLDHVDAGEINVDGANVARFRGGAQRRFRRDTLGYLFQNYALIENESVDFNLSIAAGARPQARRHDGFREALHTVGLADRGKEPVYRLSGGEQQRLALARLLVKKPTLVLADEPTGALDSDNADLVISLLRRMADGGATVVIATHSKHVESSCDATLDLARPAGLGLA
jgi:putative ABC transport system ATP-binding protein